MRRLDKTLIDYLIIAISPALIMTLVGSLVFFLLDVFYKGNFAGRLNVIFALFVFAAVLVARIAIDEGRERAALFAFPLAVVTFLAIMRFVQFQGSLQSFSFIINIGLIGLVWWSADRLTWDCTMIDEDEEDSGEGLLEAVGLDEPGKAALQKEITPPEKGDRGILCEAPEGPSRQNAPVPFFRRQEPRPPAGGNRLIALWDRFLAHRRRPHAPGLWVVYFSLAALPLFGIGQFFIPAADQENRQYAFQLLCIYTASGLGLLLATSFLGLRRYLRQRRQEMPLPIVNLWLGIGAALIVAAMFVALILPRSNAEYDLSELAVRVGSPDQSSSAYSVGSEGVEENQPDAQAQPRENESGDATTDQPSDKTDDSQSDENGTNGKPSEGKSNQAGDASSQEDAQKQSDSNDSPSKKTSQDQSKEKKKQGDENSSRDSAENKSQDAQSQGSSSPNQEPQKKNESPEKKNGQNAGSRPHAPTIPRLSSPAGIAWLAGIVKWVFYGLLAIVIIYLVWRNREALWKAFCDFVQFFIDLWQNLFGGGRSRAKEAAEAAAAKKPLPRFADFRDPFASGAAGRYPPAELVRYTFEALEAWARDRGRPRHPDQTPHEFVRTLTEKSPALGDDVTRLAELYCQVAYAPFNLPPASAARLAELWRIMRAETTAAATAGV